MAKTQLIKCTCGARFSIKQKQIGKKGKCKKCGKQFVIPAPPKKESDLGAFSQVVETAPKQESAPRPTCPECRKVMDSVGNICKNCGYHRNLGYKLKSISDAKFSENPVIGVPLVYGLILAFGLMFLTGQINSSIEGPSFLALFFGCFFVFGIATALFRQNIQDADFIQDAALVGLLGMGAIRIHYSVTNERYKFLLLVLGMIVSIIVFFLSKTRDRQKSESPFVSDSGGMKLGHFWWLFGIGLVFLAVCFFTPAFRNLGKGMIPALVISGIITFITALGFMGIEMGGSGGGGGGYSSSSGGGCGGGGCGGGCGGGGCGG